MSGLPGDPAGARHHAVRTLRLPALLQADGGVEHSALPFMPAESVQLGP